MEISSKELNNYINKISQKTDIYLHLSENILKQNELQDIHQPIVEEYNCGGRPNGLWYSHGNSWLNFIVNNKNINPIFKPCCYLYEIKLDESQILKLDNYNQIKKFDDYYSDYYLNVENYNLCGYRKLNPSRYIDYYDFNTTKFKNKTLYDYLESKNIVFSDKDKFKKHLNQYYINVNKNVIEERRNKRWDIVAKDYDGVHFTPYQKNINNINWYKSISISSGCVWNVKAIKALYLVAHVINKNFEHIKNIWKLTDYGEYLLK